jgi:hypothetical protein
LAASEKVKVKVRDGLATILSVIDDDSKPFLFVAFLLSNDANGQQEMPKEFLVGVLCFGNSWNGPFGYEKQMNWSLRSDVFKAEAMIVLIDNLSGNFPRDDFFKKSHVVELR